MVYFNDIIVSQQITMNRNSNPEKINICHNSHLRLLPGMVIVILQWIIGFIVPLIIPETLVAGVFAGMLGGLAVIIWWIFFSRAKNIDRFGPVILIFISLYAASRFLHESIKTGNMGLMFIIYAIPVMSIAFVIAVLIGSFFSSTPRRVIAAVSIIIASGGWILLASNGIDGNGRPDFTWRWILGRGNSCPVQTPDESYETPPLVQEDAKTAWTGFRGANRDSVIRGTSINANWPVNPPRELWRRPVGAGCSSFAAGGNLLYTQEQNGDYEVVSCYDLLTGKPVWKHKDKARFYDSHAGAGPRSTPALAGNRLYTLGATGILNALDARSGTVVWSRDAAKDSGVKAITWGFTGSPLVVGKIVITALAGKLAAYESSDGTPRWFGPDGGNSYSSPQLFISYGIPQILHMSRYGARSFDPSSGRQIWQHPWEISDRILQPAVTETGGLLLALETKSLRHIAVLHKNEQWDIKEIWTTADMNANFTDYVIHKNHAYGFYGPGIACLDIKNGLRKWKGGRCRGFTLLLADQDLLIVVSEKGEAVLISALPEKFTELGRFQAVTGKTWNHPALSGNILLVRNAREMAAFDLAAPDI
ncbi:MAG TPA: hypothetical protein DC049_03485 [Spirochaetia bacterium]|nr:hypothetical protein [Spirochaetia bacterium]